MSSHSNQRGREIFTAADKFVLGVFGVAWCAIIAAPGVGMVMPEYRAVAIAVAGVAMIVAGLLIAPFVLRQRAAAESVMCAAAVFVGALLVSTSGVW